MWESLHPGPPSSSFRVPVVGVICRGSQKQMVHFNTAGIITTMTDAHTGWDGAVGLNPSNAVRANKSALISAKTVPMPIFAAGPLHAAEDLLIPWILDGDQEFLLEVLHFQRLLARRWSQATMRSLPL